MWKLKKIADNYEGKGVKIPSIGEVGNGRFGYTGGRVGKTVYFQFGRKLSKNLGNS